MYFNLKNKGTGHSLRAAERTAGKEQTAFYAGAGEEPALASTIRQVDTEGLALHAIEGAAVEVVVADVADKNDASDHCNHCHGDVGSDVSTESPVPGRPAETENRQ